jgi:hypothetical protein
MYKLCGYHGLADSLCVQAAYSHIDDLKIPLFS